jgi:CheY-like chemotaxis protein
VTRSRSSEKILRGRTVLVVEDHADSLHVTELILRAQGAHVLTATNGLDALAMLETGRLPDVVLCDLRMPLMDGFELMRRLRETPRLSRLTVLAVTAYGEYPDLLRTWSAGFDGHLTKPVEPDELTHAIKRVLWAHHPSRARRKKPASPAAPRRPAPRGRQTPPAGTP